MRPALFALLLAAGPTAAQAPPIGPSPTDTLTLQPFDAPANVPVPARTTDSAPRREPDGWQVDFLFGAPFAGRVERQRPPGRGAAERVHVLNSVGHTLRV